MSCSSIKPRSLLSSRTPAHGYGSACHVTSEDAIAMRRYFACMPRPWMDCLMEDENFYLVDDEDYEMLDVYLKNIGFTGRPIYACLKCQCLYDCDMTWKWKDTVLENTACATCGAQLVSYKQQQQQQQLHR